MKKKIEILCSTGTLVSKINGRDYRMITKFAPQIQCDGFEFLMVPEFYENCDTVAKEVKAAGINFKTFHIEKDIGWYLSRLEDGDENRAFGFLKQDLRMANLLGLEFCVFHLWGGAESDAHVARNIGFLDRILECCREYGVTLSVENVPCTTHSPYENIKLLTSMYPEIPVTFDSRFAAFHGQEKAFCEDEELWKNNIRHIHISDIAKEMVDERKLRPILHPGEGCADFDTVFERLRTSYSGTLTLESPVFLPEFKADTDKLNRSLNGLDGILNGK